MRQSLQPIAAIDENKKLLFFSNFKCNHSLKIFARVVKLFTCKHGLGEGSNIVNVLLLLFVGLLLVADSRPAKVRRQGLHLSISFRTRLLALAPVLHGGT